MCHRLHTVLHNSWNDTINEEPEAQHYETSISELCRFAKQSTGFQEQLPKSLKHGGDTRPWFSMYRRSESVDDSYDVLVQLLTEKDKLSMIANVSRTINKEILTITKSIIEVFEALQKVDELTLHLVPPSYYLIRKKLSDVPGESKTLTLFKIKLCKYLDDKFWTSIKAMHWMACFMDPSFKTFSFLPQDKPADIEPIY